LSHLRELKPFYYPGFGGSAGPILQETHSKTKYINSLFESAFPSIAVRPKQYFAGPLKSNIYPANITWKDLKYMVQSNYPHKGTIRMPSKT